MEIYPVDIIGKNKVGWLVNYSLKTKITVVSSVIHVYDTLLCTMMGPFLRPGPSGGFSIGVREAFMAKQDSRIEDVCCQIPLRSLLASG